MAGENAILALTGFQEMGATETLVYRPSGSVTTRSIQALVRRNPPESVPGSPVIVRSQRIEITVLNDATYGISASELNTGGDGIDVAPTPGGTAATRETFCSPSSSSPRRWFSMSATWQFFVDVLDPDAQKVRIKGIRSDYETGESWVYYHLCTMSDPQTDAAAIAAVFSALHDASVVKESMAREIESSLNTDAKTAIDSVEVVRAVEAQRLRAEAEAQQQLDTNPAAEP